LTANGQSINRCRDNLKREADDIGHKVELEKACEADFASPEVEDAGHEAQPDVGGDDAVAFVGFENGRRGVEVLLEKMREYFERDGVFYIGSRRMCRGAHDVREEVVLPTDGLHEEDASEGVDRGFFKHLVIVGYVCGFFGREVVVGAFARYVVFVALDRNGGFVVGMVGRFPCVEGTEDELEVQHCDQDDGKWRGRTDGVKTETYEVVQPVVVGERAVSSLVRHAPPASEDDTLPVPVEHP